MVIIYKRSIMKKKGEGKVVSYTKRSGVVIEGFDNLTNRDLDILDNISTPGDIDNKRSYYRKKKTTKAKTKRKSKKDCGCK